MAIKKILLCSPPPARKVLYVVQTFGWVRSADGKSDQMNWLLGGGLRVYADRPWNVSGHKEICCL